MPFFFDDDASNGEKNEREVEKGYRPLSFSASELASALSSEGAPSSHSTLLFREESMPGGRPGEESMPGESQSRGRRGRGEESGPEAAVEGKELRL